MPNGHLVKVGSYSTKFSEKEYEPDEVHNVGLNLLICEDDNPPMYETPSGIFPQPLYTHENSHEVLQCLSGPETSSTIPEKVGQSWLLLSGIL